MALDRDTLLEMQRQIVAHRSSSKPLDLAGSFSNIEIPSQESGEFPFRKGGVGR